MRYTCLLLISMLWHREAMFKSKGDTLASSAECRIRTQCLRHQIASWLNARWRTDWAIEDQAKNLNSTARPYDQQALSPLDPTASSLWHLALAIYMFVVNFDALAQASVLESKGDNLSSSVEIVSKTQSQWHARGCTGQLTTRLECTGVNGQVRLWGLVHNYFFCMYTFWIRLAAVSYRGKKVRTTASTAVRSVNKTRDTRNCVQN